MDPLKTYIGNFPVYIYCERRYNSRVSIGKNGVYIRVSRFLDREGKNKTIKNFITWAEKKIEEKPDQYLKNNFRIYENGKTFEIYNQSFIIIRTYKPSGNPIVKVSPGKLLIKSSESEEVQNEQISKKVARAMGDYFKDALSSRLNMFNEWIFRKKINQIRLKNNSSNWGSCSHHGNINISTRLLFAPMPVIDYVLIHELAHLVVHNHSAKFWNLVKKVMPEYQKQVDWLKEHGHSYYF